MIIDKCDDDEDDLIFGEVTDVLIADKCSIIFEFFVVKGQYLHHYHAHELLLPPVLSRKKYLIKQRDLAHYQPLGLYYCSSISNNSLMRYAVTRSNVYFT